jgi:flagellar basal-body rod protein FlgF
MSSKGIFSALSGAMAQSQRLDTISNNIANANTTAFKKDRQVFREYLTATEKPPDVIQVPRIPATTESFYDNQGGDRGYVDAAGTFTDLSQGALKNTGDPMDLAIEGQGFFEVATGNGLRFTRSGHLKVDGEGRLVTSEGHPVLAEGGAGGDAAQRALRVSGQRPITISYSGEVYDGDQLVGKLSVVDFQNRDALMKQGSSLYSLRSGFNGQPQAAPGVKIHQGFSELSNVNVVEEMADMILASRAFETNQKSIKAFDEMDEKLVNQVPKT